MTSSAWTRSASIESTFLKPDAQRQHLEAAAVGEGRPRPVHEGAEAARLVDDVGAGLQIEVVGVGQNRLRANVFHRLGQHRLDGGLRADGDERRSVDVAVRRVDDADPAEPPGKLRFDAERRLCHEVYSISSA